MSLPLRQLPYIGPPSSVTLPPHRRSRSHQGHITTYSPYTQLGASPLSFSPYSARHDQEPNPIQSLPASGPIRRLSSSLVQDRYSSISPPASGPSTWLPPMPAPLNAECEHWLVTSKEAARRMEDLSVLDKSLLNSVVTFEPASYTTVAGSGPGQNAWFKAQCCSCETYKNGFQKVRRPATIRAHLSKQPCAPPALAQMAELQLRLLRSFPRRLSNASPLSPGPSPRNVVSPDFEPNRYMLSGQNSQSSSIRPINHLSYPTQILAHFDHHPHLPDMAYSWPPTSSSWPSIQGSFEARLSQEYPEVRPLADDLHKHSQTPRPASSLQDGTETTHMPYTGAPIVQDGIHMPVPIHPEMHGYDYLTFDDL